MCLKSGYLYSYQNNFRGYRFAFNGQEQDNEISGTGNIMTAEFWMYDGRLGRRWNVDPVVKFYESPYACFSNNPIWLIDKDGADSTVYIFTNKNGPIKPQELEKYKNETEKVFKENGIHALKFSIISEDEAKKLKLDRTDALLLITTYGAINGETHTHDNGELSRLPWGSSFNIKFAEEKNEILKNNCFAMSKERMVGILSAHEIWHQYLSKSYYDIHGAIPWYGNDDPQKGHDNSTVNLNMDGDEMLRKVWANPNSQSVGAISKILPQQRQLFYWFLIVNSRKEN